MPRRRSFLFTSLLLSFDAEKKGTPLPPHPQPSFSSVCPLPQVIPFCDLPRAFLACCLLFLCDFLTDMPPPVLGSSSSSSSSSVRQSTSSPSSFAYSPSAPRSADWFLGSSYRDNHIFAQALTCELSSQNGPAPSAHQMPPSSPKSLAEALSEVLANRTSWQTSNLMSGNNISDQSIVAAALQQNHQHQHQLQLQQQQHEEVSTFSQSPLNIASQQVGSPNISNTPSPMSASDLKDRASVPTSPYSSSTDSKPFPTMLSAQTSVGAASSKVAKRRPRPSNKAPTTVLSADMSNFRDMVQKLTGIPTSPPPQRGRCQQVLGGSQGMSNLSLLKPVPFRPPHQAIHSLPTLDTSSTLLSSQTQLPYMHTSSSLQFGPFGLQANYGEVPSGQAGTNVRGAADTQITTRHVPHVLLNQGALPGMKPNPHSIPSRPQLWDSFESPDCKDIPKLNGGGFMEGESCTSKEEGGEFEIKSTESLLMEDDCASKTCQHEDLWLSFDTSHINSHTPKVVETARTA